MLSLGGGKKNLQIDIYFMLEKYFFNGFMLKRVEQRCVRKIIR